MTEPLLTPRTKTGLEPPAGEAPDSPALGAPRPALKVLQETLSHPLRSHLASARELARRRRQERDERPLPTAEPALDGLLGGGLERGALTELVGGRSSGRFSLMLAALAAATGVGEAAALVDLGDGLDPRAAALAGVDLSRLLWLRPRRLKEALAAAETAFSGGFPLVVLDLGLPPVRGARAQEASWLRLARAARDCGAALLVGSPYRVSGTAAAAVLTARRRGALWQGRGAAPRLLAGLGARLAVDKRRGAAPGESASLQLAADPILPALPTGAAAAARGPVGGREVGPRAAAAAR